jgi:16S rRNA (cytosine967-C5)-methyltransferase
MPVEDPLEIGLRGETTAPERTPRRTFQRPSNMPGSERPSTLTGAAVDDRWAMDIAMSVISKASAEKPADAVLRATLKENVELGSDRRALVAQLVFNYYRWHGWLHHDFPLGAQIAFAWELKGRFESDPKSFSFEELKSKAIPEWAPAHMDVTERWLQSLQQNHQLWIRARSGTGSELARTLGYCLPAGMGHLADALAYDGPDDLFRTPEFHNGAFEVQDLSSQAVSIICDPQPGETWWDACAGEGGKTIHLAGLMKNRGLIWASDRAEWRLQKLKRRAARAELFNYRTVAWDNLNKPPVKTLFEGVLLDAPCSGVGTWGRNPHARWTTTLHDVQELGQLQLQLLSCAAGSVKSGGRLIYAVCTLTREETTDVAKAFEEKFPDFKPLAVANPLEPGSLPAAQHRLGPPASNSNGMFVAVWRKA